MRKIVDSNKISHQDLSKYLSTSPSNHVIVTDYAAMEAYADACDANLLKSMRVLCNYPRQVIILRSTNNICGLSGTRKGLQKRFIDESQTRNFPTFARQLFSAVRGHNEFQRSIAGHRHAALCHISKMTHAAEKSRTGIQSFASEYTINERRMLRGGTHYPKELVGKLARHVMNISAILFSDHPMAKSLPKEPELYNTYIFRYSLCVYILAIDWMIMGGISGVQNQKLRNDIIDMHFSTYATFFDGLISADQKTIRIYQRAKQVLNTTFCCQV